MYLCLGFESDRFPDQVNNQDEIDRNARANQGGLIDTEDTKEDAEDNADDNGNSHRDQAEGPLHFGLRVFVAQKDGQTDFEKKEHITSCVG